MKFHFWGRMTKLSILTTTLNEKNIAFNLPQQAKCDTNRTE